MGIMEMAQLAAARATYKELKAENARLREIEIAARVFVACQTETNQIKLEGLLDAYSSCPKEKK